MKHKILDDPKIKHCNLTMTTPGVIIGRPQTLLPMTFMTPPAPGPWWWALGDVGLIYPRHRR